MARIATTGRRLSNAGSNCRRFAQAGNATSRSALRTSTVAFVCVILATLLVRSALPSSGGPDATAYSLRESLLPAALLDRNRQTKPNVDGGDESGLVPFTLNDGGQAIALAATSGTIGDALLSLGIVVGSSDLVTPPPDQPLLPGQHIHLRRAKTIRLGLRGNDAMVQTQTSTVADLLRETGVVLDPSDHLSAGLDSKLFDGMTLRVGRERQETVEFLDTIPFQSIRRLDPSMEIGESRRTPGRRGIVHKEVQITYSEGREVGRRVLREWIDPPPQDEIVYEGATAPARPSPVAVQRVPESTPVATPRANVAANATTTAVRATSTPTTEVREAAVLTRSVKATMTPVSKGGRIRVYATWYTPASTGAERSDPWYGKTATGVKVERGVVAVDPKVIPLGTKMFIPGYGNAVAADTGSAVVGDIIDLGFPDGPTPSWKPQWVEITILE